MPPPTTTLHGLTLTLPEPYAEGHPCTAGEAAALNRRLGDMLRNNFAARVKRMAQACGAPPWPEAEAEGVRQQFLNYANSYEFGARPAIITIDPIATEATRLARAKVLAKLREQGHNPKELSDEVVEKLIADVLARYPNITEEARKRIEAYQSIAISALEL